MKWHDCPSSSSASTVAMRGDWNCMLGIISPISGPVESPVRVGKGGARDR